MTLLLYVSLTASLQFVAQQMRQKQREFEQIMLSGVSNEEREAMWQTAQEKAVSREQLICAHCVLCFQPLHACTYMYNVTSIATN
jgi:hypothetical protein